MNRTKIEYLDWTWNPLAMRCTPVSEGCRNCWHLAMAKRLTANPLLSQEEQFAYADDGDPDKGPPFLKEDELQAPLHLKKPSRIGVQFMGDIYHLSIATDRRDKIFEIIRACEKHAFFLLTKRPAEMLDYRWARKSFESLDSNWPANAWSGITVINQKEFDECVPLLIDMPGMHWLSIEPMLGPIDLEGWLEEIEIPGDPNDEGSRWVNGIDWVICGGETGPGARPMHPDWVRSLRDQCQAAEVPFFFKQWGEWAIHSDRLGGGLFLKPDGTLGCQGDWWDGRAQAICKVGKKKAGRLLDGREWNEVPNVSR